MSRNPRIIKIVASIVVAGFALIVVMHYRVGLAKWVLASSVRQSSPEHTAQATAPGEKKILYYYDAMSPEHHYNKPGKAPDGMDLVPQYADDSGGAQSSGGSSGDTQDMPGMKDMTPAPDKTKPGERKILFWYDPMHPAYKSDKPGIAPDCGMRLVPKYADEDMGKMPVGTVKIPPEKQQVIGVRTETVERQDLVRSVRTTGQLTADETKIAHVHVKTSGYIEEIYVDYVGQLVKKGQPLFTVYSPDLLATQEEYLIAKRGVKELGTAPFEDVSQGSQSLLHATRGRLKLWDITDEQIKKLDETGEVSKTLTFYSPISGFVTDRKAFPQTAITPDMDLYVISDLSTIWVNADVFEYEVPFVKVGQTAEMQLSYYAGKTYTGKITYIYPNVDSVSRTVKIRIEFPNPDFDLKPQMFANVQLKINYGKSILVPQEAVMDSGDKQYVFVVHEGNVFEPRVIQMGAKLEGKVVVMSGLTAGEAIVTSGNFLIDSESRLKSAMGGMKH